MLTYSEWTERLCKHYFNESNAGRPVTFFVDDEVLGLLEGGGDASTGVASLAQAVRSRLALDSWGRRFARIDDECGRWKAGGAIGCPPSLPLLAVAVLAGTHMAAESGISAANYWKRFRDILNLHETNDLKGYQDVFPGLWQQLTWWLDTDHGGGLGTSTVDDDPWPTVIGYALSQSLFREADRQHLSELFQKLDLVPGEPIDPAELLQYFKAWAPRSPLSRGARLMAADAHYDERLSALLRDEAARYDGTRRDAEGRHLASLVILFEPFPVPTYRVAAERPSTFPEIAEFGNGEFSIQLSPLVEGWYAEAWSLDDAWLGEGLRLSHAGFVLLLRHAGVVPFTRNRDFGCWSSVSKFEPSEPHVLLVTEQLKDRVAEYLGSHALAGWKAEPAEFAPKGWSLFTNVVVEESPKTPPEGPLAVLMPVVRERPTFRGGLLLDLSVRMYLHGGEPDLWLPSLMGADTSVEVDGTVIDAEPGSRIPLRDLQLSEGAHEVVVGASNLSFRTVPSLKAGEAQGTGSVVHRLRRANGGYLPVSLGATVDASVGLGGDGEVSVSGAHLDGAADDLPPAQQTVLLPAGAADYLLLGARVGEVMEVHEPPRPKWLDNVAGKKLFPSGFDVHSSFPVVWAVYERFGRSVARLVSARPPREWAGAEDAAASRWRNTFRSDPEVHETDQALWDAYIRVADGVDLEEEAVLAVANHSVANHSPSANEGEPASADEDVADPLEADPHELLLRWTSELGTGSWTAFRNAHDWLFNAGRSESEQVKATTTIHNHSILGHIEVDWQADRWAAAPGAITILPSAGGHAVMAGSRTRKRTRRFMDVVNGGERDVFAEAHPQEWGPSAIFLAAGSDQDIEDIAAEVGVRYEVCVSERLAALLPSIDSYLQLGDSTPGAKGYGVERFDTSYMLFRRCESDSEPGFYRYDVPGRPELRFVDDTRSYFRVDRALGIYAELRRAKQMVLRWEPDSVNGTLFVPYRAQLPVLHARAAVLSCGLAPILQRGPWEWIYRNVPRESARRIGASLGQVIP